MASPSPSIHHIENKPFLDLVLGHIQSRFESDRLLYILDIGCGVGHFTEILGRELGARARITGIDPNADVVREGMERIGKSDVKNVELKVSPITEFDEGKKYDVLMFTKSLHHCFPLDESVSKAHNLLAPNGLFIADEIIHKNLSTATYNWFFDRFELLYSAGVFTIPQSHYHGHGDHKNAHSHSHHGDAHHHDETSDAHARFALLFNQSLPRLERWAQAIQHNPPLHDKDEMIAAISKVFGNDKTRTSRNTFFYHNLSVGLQDTPVGAQVMSNLMSQELRAVEDGSIDQVGCTIIAEKN